VRYVLDTNIAVAALNLHPAVLARLEAVPAAELGLPLLVIGELTYGAHRSRRVAENLARIRSLRESFPVLPVTEGVIERYAVVRSELESQGRPKADFDLVIACTALQHGAVLVTHDTALLDGAIAGLVVEDWLAVGAGRDLLPR